MTVAGPSGCQRHRLPLVRRAFLSLLAASPLFAQKPSSASAALQMLPFDEAWPLIDSLRPHWPPEWIGLDRAGLASRWPSWLESKQQALIRRLDEGELDTTIHFLLYGASFTSQFRVTPQDFPQIEAAGLSLAEVIDRRIIDLLTALNRPSSDERLRFAAAVLRAHTRLSSNPQHQAAAREFLKSQAVRVLSAQRNYEQQRDSLRRTLSPSEAFVSESSLFRQRGLSLDTSLPPCFGIHAALADARLPAASLRRAGVVGPGLDFTDKAAGLDLYPPQSIQPFLFLDSLLALAQAAPDAAIYACDISPRTLSFLARAVDRAARNIPLEIHLARDANVAWTDNFNEYYAAAGMNIGAAAPTPQTLRRREGVEVRSLRLRPTHVRRIRPLRWDVLTTRYPAPLAASFDLLIATNVFVYYDPLEQALAMRNVAHMLKPGGLFLVNNALPALPETGLAPLRVTAVDYSSRQSDGDQIIHFQRNP